MNYTALLDAIQKNQITPVHQQLVSQLKQHPTDHQAYFVLAQLNIKIQNLNKAEAIFAKCISLAPLPLYIIEKAKLALYLQKPLEAKQSLAMLDMASVKDAHLLDTCANLHLRLNQHQLAYHCFKAAYDKAPEHPNIALNYAICEKMMGQLENAEKRLTVLCEQHPSFTRAQIALSELTGKEQAQERIEALLALLPLQAENNLYHYDLLHALALEHEKLGDYEKAWHYFCESKQRIAIDAKFNPASFSTFMDNLRALTGKPIEFEPFTDIQPIFVVGMPRSGTSLTEQLLSQLPNIDALGELSAFPAYLNFTGDYASNWQNIIKEYQNGDACRAYRALYIQLAKGKKAIDKLPFNFMFIDILSKAFPNAKFVFVHRNPKDVVIANFRQHYQINSPFHQYCFSLSGCELATLQAERLRTTCFSDYAQVTSLCYEALVAEPERTLNSLCAFLNEQFTPELLKFYKQDYFSATASKLQLRKPLNTDGINRYSNYKTFLAKNTDSLSS